MITKVAMITVEVKQEMWDVYCAARSMRVDMVRRGADSADIDAACAVERYQAEQVAESIWYEILKRQDETK